MAPSPMRAASSPRPSARLRGWSASRPRMPVARASRKQAAAAATTEAEAKPGLEVAGNNFEPVLDINEVMKILPHRYPFLLVDKVIELERGSYAVGVKNVTVNDNFFPGHFPQRPIMPGVLQVEAMAQVGGIVLLDPNEDGDGTGTKQQFFFGGVDSCRFRKPVVPGDTLHMKVELIKLQKRFGIAKMKGTCYVGNDVTCEAELMLVLGKEE